MKCSLCGVLYNNEERHDAIECEKRISRMIIVTECRLQELKDSWQEAYRLAQNQKIENQRNQEGFYSLRRSDASHLGGPMGSEYTTTDWVKLFDSEKKAKEFAKGDAGRQPEWKEGLLIGDVRYLTWDAGSHIYTIKKEEVISIG